MFSGPSRASLGPAVLLMLCLAACSSPSMYMTGPAKTARASGGLKPEKERSAAPDFSLKDADGRTAHLSEYRGKVVLLNFWATWCGPCKIEIPWFVDLEQRLKDRGFAVLGVAMDDEGWPVVKPFLSDLRVNYRVLMGDSATADLYGGVESLPTTFVIDRDGRIANVHVGVASADNFENEIEQLLLAPVRDADGAVGGVSAVRASAE